MDRAVSWAGDAPDDSSAETVLLPLSTLGHSLNKQSGHRRVQAHGSKPWLDGLVPHRSFESPRAESANAACDSTCIQLQRLRTVRIRGPHPRHIHDAINSGSHHDVLLHEDRVDDSNGSEPERQLVRNTPADATCDSTHRQHQHLLLVVRSDRTVRLIRGGTDLN